MTTSVLHPATAPRRLRNALAQRLPRLEGARIGLLDNSKSNAGTLLDRVAEALASQNQNMTFLRLRKQAPGMPATAEQIAELAACDGVLIASAD